MPADELKKGLEAIATELKRAGVTALSADESVKRLKAAGAADPSICGGKPACLAALASKVGASWVVTVSVTKLGRDRAWVLEAIDGKLSASSVREEWLDETNGDVAGPASSFSARLGAAMKPKDLPVEVKLEPAPPQPPPPPPVTSPPLVLVDTPASSKVAPRVLLVGASVAVLVAVGLGIGAATTSATLNRTTEGPNGVRLSALTEPEAERLRGTTDALTASSVAAGILGAGLGVGAALTW